jgi:hypothetical protein
MPSTFVISPKGRSPVTFSTDWRDNEVAEWLAEHGDEFGKSLAAKMHYWTGTQRAWAHYLRHKAETQGPARPRTRGLESIVELFETAIGKGEPGLGGDRLKRAKITFKLSTGRTVALSLAGAQSRYPGSVTVTDGGGYQRSVFYGRIQRDGSTSIDDPEVLEFLRDFATDPQAKAAEYGKRSGSCCFCARDLKDARSMAVGYGPSCASRYGLHWG